MTLIAVSIVLKSSTPANTPDSRPMPPRRLTPPMTTAAKASNSMPRPRLAVAPLVRAASHQPEAPDCDEGGERDDEGVDAKADHQDAVESAGERAEADRDQERQPGRQLDPGRRAAARRQ